MPIYLSDDLTPDEIADTCSEQRVLAAHRACPEQRVLAAHRDWYPGQTDAEFDAHRKP